MTFIVDGSLGGTFPSWTTATRPASPAVGQMGYNTTTGAFDMYTASGWQSVLSTTPTGNITFASGTNGIVFNNSSALTNSVLNDYETGTWTPNQGSGLTVIGTFSSSGTYTKIGNQVTLYGKVTGSTSIAASGTGQICTNTPFTSNGSVTLGSGAAFNSTSTSGAIINIAPSNTIYTESAVASATTIWFSLTYQTTF